MRTRGAALELGMRLRGDEPRVQVAAQLDHLDQLAIRARAGHDQAGRLQLLAVRAVELVTMTMALLHQRLAIRLRRERACDERARIRAKAHGAALLGHALLLIEQVDHGVRALRVELG